MARLPSTKRRARTQPKGARASWAMVLGLLTTVPACGFSSAAGSCDTESLPVTDPCHGKGCCDSVTVGPDGGLIEDAGADAGPGVTSRICGACNG